MIRSLFPILLLTSLTMTAHAQDPASADTFEREALKALKAAHAAKRSVVVHIGGQTIAGAVKAIGPDSIILSNREHATIIVRRERIDAVEAD
jgi:FAD/FMN-containing dehydrogenase